MEHFNGRWVLKATATTGGSVNDFGINIVVSNN